MTTIYLIRHAEAEGNLYRRAHGHYNSLITDNGYLQIKALSKRLEGITFDGVWSSDLFRTMTTARAIIDRTGQPLYTHEGIREMNLGDWEDKTWGEIEIEFTEELALFSKSDSSLQITNGESFQQLMARLQTTITEIASKYPDGTVAIFCHGLAIRQFLSLVEGLPEDQWNTRHHSDNTGVNQLTWDGTTFKVEVEADSSHLNDEISTFARQNWWRKDYGGVVADKNLCFSYATTPEEQDFYQQSQKTVWGDTPSTAETIVVVKHNGELVGVIALGLEGTISLFYLKEGYQGQCLGIQMLGKVVSETRKNGGEWLTLQLPEGSERAEKFFQRYGFGEDRKKYIGYTPRKSL
ncbi:MAG: GNAT family N-acetyltransferase [Eubacteriales bacterium]